MFVCERARERNSKHKRERVRENQLLIVSCFSFGFVFVSLTASSYYSLLDASVDVASSWTFGCPLFLFASFLHSRWFRSFVQTYCIFVSIFVRFFISFVHCPSVCLFACLYVSCIYLLEHTDFLFTYTLARCYSHSLCSNVRMIERFVHVHMCGQCDCVRAHAMV